MIRYVARTGMLLWLIVAASSIGALLALFGAYQTLLAQYAGVARLRGCSINAWISCEKALGSGSAMIFGVPIAWLGFLYYLMNFPLDRKMNFALPNAPHEQAGLAARAAVCAQQHGGFWEFHDRLFEHQEGLSLDFILNLAAQQGWDREAFAQEIEARDTYLRVIAEIQYASRVQISSTPAVIINGRLLQYWEHPEILQSVVREEIQRVE